MCLGTSCSANATGQSKSSRYRVIVTTSHPGAEASRQLPRAVRAEVEHDHNITRGNARPAGQDDRLDELVRDAFVVASFHFLDGVRPLHAFAADQCRKCALGPLPALVAVHRVVAAGDGGDPLRGQFREILDRGGRRDVAAVRERMWIHVRSGIPSRSASSSSARRWSMCEWTPP